MLLTLLSGQQAVNRRLSPGDTLEIGYRVRDALGNERFFPGGQTVVQAIAAAFTGLSTDSIGQYGRIGNHASIGFTITPAIPPDEIKWSASSNPAAVATFGTGANPSDFASADEFAVYLHLRFGPTWVSGFFPARYAPGTLPAMADQTFSLGAGGTYQHPAATGTGLTWTYAQVGPIAGVTYDANTRTFTFASSLAAQSGTAFAVSATDKYGRPAGNSPRSATFTIVDVTITEEVDGTVTVDVGTGLMTITITSPAPYSTFNEGNGAGVYIRDSALLASGPVLLHPGVVAGDGTPAPTETVSLLHNPLWIYAGTSPVQTYNWQADVAANGVYSNLGDTDTSYVLTVTEAGDQVRLAYTFTDSFGARSGFTNALLVEGGVVSDDIIAGDASIIINALAPLGPDLVATAGDASIIITGA
jgi:hypothetical protein